MKNFLRYGLTAIALVFVLGAFAATQTNAQVNDILKRMDEHYKALKSLKTSVTMDKFNSQLGEHDITKGTAMYVPQKGRDALVRIDWTEPVQESLAVVNKDYVLFRPRLKQALVGKTSQTKGNAKANSALAFMNMSKEQLKANYNIKYLGEEKVGGTTSTWHLELTPKAATSYKMAEIWVDGNGMPVQMKVIENNNDSTTILLSNIDKNSSIDTSVFKIVLPKDTKIIKN
jgi:outer membrane lipoprotein-sorting protein